LLLNIWKEERKTLHLEEYYVHIPAQTFLGLAAAGKYD
jgi:hypothetical protein